MRGPLLVCRSYYSLLRASASIERLVQAAAAAGYDGIALADVNAMYGATELFKYARSAGMRAILGVQILTDSDDVILIAENEAGYHNLCRIVSSRNICKHFDLASELSISNTGLICIVRDLAALTKLAHILPKGNIFAMCADAAQAKAAISKGFEPVACGVFSAIDGQDEAATHILNRIRELSVEGSGLADKAQPTILPSHDEFARRFAGCRKALANAFEIMNRCDANLLGGRLYLPKVALPNGRTSAGELSRLCHLGLAGRYGIIKRNIIKRLEYELSIIQQNNFCDYFLVVHKIVDFARSRGIPVDVRGSAAGALVSYVLGFTRVDPIEHNLYFERFMNPGRKDCPDIDIDLCWRRRDEVIQFCYENWGRDHVAMICTINRYRQRGAIRDVGRYLTLSPWQVDELVRRRRDDARSAVYQLAQRLIGIPRHTGIHCGGIVITPGPIAEYVPLEPATKGIVVTQYDKHAAEAAGLVKIDLLGNRSLSTVADAVNLVKRNHETLDIDAIDKADPLTAGMLTQGESLGVFQCESPGMRQLLRGMKIRNMNDTGIALSLIRPGPAAGGSKAEFIERHINGKHFEYMHPKMKRLLEETHGVMLYQEDVMRIAVEVAGYSIAEANQFRSEVSSKVSPESVHRQYTDFVYVKALRAGIDRSTAEAIWNDILRFAAYSYCKAHAIVYANIAWLTAYLRAHWPLEFHTSLFNNHQGMYPLRVYVWDAIRRGIDVLSPHINSSDVEWTIDNNAIRAGLGIVKGLSRRTIKAIFSERQRHSFENLDDFRIRARPQIRELKDLIHLGACDGLGVSRPAMLMAADFEPRDQRQNTLFELHTIPTRRELPDYDKYARMNAEVACTGIPFSMHPASLIPMRHIPASRLSEYAGRDVTVAGLLATARLAATNDDRLMGFISIDDASGLSEITFFPDKIADYRRLAEGSGPVWVRGRVKMHLSSVTIEFGQGGPVQNRLGARSLSTGATAS
jgi:DNA polymerase III alpha subunit